MNNWKMRCIDNRCNDSMYTNGKIYEVKNGTFTDDDGYLHIQYDNFHHWAKKSSAIWELIIEPSNEINELRQELNKKNMECEDLRQQLEVLLKNQSETPESTGWEIPHHTEIRYSINERGNVQPWKTTNGDYEQDCAKNLNIFSLPEKCQQIANEQLAYRMARKFADEWEGVGDGCLWEIYYNTVEKRFIYEASRYFTSFNFIFPSQKSVEAFIDQHGEKYAKLLGWELE